VTVNDINAPGALYTVSRDAVLKDVQFRGAISDFHVLKAVLLTADYDPLVLRSNPEDVYGDGNNFEVRSTLPRA
jgi:hypothetical protein